jgi:hypothetical protein
MIEHTNAIVKIVEINLYIMKYLSAAFAAAMISTSQSGDKSPDSSDYFFRTHITACSFEVSFLHLPLRKFDDLAFGGLLSLLFPMLPSFPQRVQIAIHCVCAIFFSPCLF